MARVATVGLLAATTGCSGLLGLDEFGAQPGGEGGGTTTTSTGDTTTATATTTSVATSSSTSTGAGGDGGSGPGSTGQGGGGHGGEGLGGDPSPGGGPSAGGGGTGGEAPTCDLGTHTCVTDVPGGWAGPVALYERPAEIALPACAGSYPTTVAQYSGDLDPGVAACDCSCSPAMGVTCGGNAQLCYRSSQNGCIQACITPNATIANTACINVSVSGEYVQVIGPAPTNVGSCQAQTNHVIPTPQWDTEAKACGGGVTSPLGCGEGEICAPRVVDGVLCISRGGDATCPAEVWTTKRVFHEGYSDTRACSACSCGGAQSTCGGSVTFSYGGNSCATDTFGAGSVPAGGCGAVANDFAAHARYVQSPSGTCPAQGGALSGDVTLDGAVTFCCTN